MTTTQFSGSLNYAANLLDVALLPCSSVYPAWWERTKVEAAAVRAFSGTCWWVSWSPFHLLFSIGEKLSEKSGEWKKIILILCFHKPRLLNMGHLDSVTSDKLLKTGLNVTLNLTSTQMLSYLTLQYLVLGVKSQKEQEKVSALCTEAVNTLGRWCNKTSCCTGNHL